MATFADLEREMPGLAADGRWLFKQNGGVAFLATVRRDGSPQVHPVMPLVVDGEIYVLIVNLSSKHGDLLRDGRYALHAIPAGEENLEFLVRGRARRIDDEAALARVLQVWGRQMHDFETLFAFDIDHALGTRWANWGTDATWPSFERWKP